MNRRRDHTHPAAGLTDAEKGVLLIIALVCTPVALVAGLVTALA